MVPGDRAGHNRGMNFFRGKFRENLNILGKFLGQKAVTCGKTQVVQFIVGSNHDSLEKSGPSKRREGGGCYLGIDNNLFTGTTKGALYLPYKYVDKIWQIF